MGIKQKLQQIQKKLDSINSNTPEDVRQKIIENADIELDEIYSMVDDTINAKKSSYAQLLSQVEQQFTRLDAASKMLTSDLDTLDLVDENEVDELIASELKRPLPDEAIHDDFDDFCKEIFSGATQTLNDLEKEVTNKGG
jgi:hypothetical protein